MDVLSYSSNTEEVFMNQTDHLESTDGQTFTGSKRTWSTPHIEERDLATAETSQQINRFNSNDHTTFYS